MGHSSEMWHNPPRPLQGTALPKSLAFTLTSLVSEQEGSLGAEPQASSHGLEMPVALKGCCKVTAWL